MKVVIRIIADDASSVVGVEALTDNGKKLSKFETAYYLNKVAAGLIKEGVSESGARLITPAAAVPGVRFNS